MFEDTTEELFDQSHRVLHKGPYFLTQKLLPLLADGGAIVNTTSNSALTTGGGVREETRRCHPSAGRRQEAFLNVMTKYSGTPADPSGNAWHLSYRFV